MISGPDLEIAVMSGGTPPYTYSIDGGITFGPENIFTGLEKDSTYTVIVRDALDCILILTEVTIITTSINSLPANGSLHITPNPSDGTVRVDLGGSAASGLHIGLYDMSDRSVYASYIRNATGGSLELELPAIHNGCYLLQIRDEKSCRTGKLVIQK